jgi:hypothetical protein
VIAASAISLCPFVGSTDPRRATSAWRATVGVGRVTVGVLGDSHTGGRLAARLRDAVTTDAAGPDAGDVEAGRAGTGGGDGGAPAPRPPRTASAILRANSPRRDGREGRARASPGKVAAAVWRGTTVSVDCARRLRVNCARGRPTPGAAATPKAGAAAEAVTEAALAW